MMMMMMDKLLVFQLVPYYVLNVINFPGLPGIFLAVLFSGSLRYVSSGILTCFVVCIY